MKHNFGAGPGILPQFALEEAAKGVLNFNGIGLSILEISHRSTDFEAVLQKAIDLVRELLKVPDNYSILFLQGGASMQFGMVPFNLLEDGHSASYLDTGVWSSKAIAEAKIFGNVEVVASGKSVNYASIPKDYSVSEHSDYFHITSNNTIYGTQLKKFPKSKIPLVADMSSDIFSREFNVEDFSLIYAGAQKNMGPAGTTLVIVKNDILGKVSRKIPSMLNYKLQIEGGSMYNTPPVFAIYVCMLTLEWLKNLGGVEEIEIRNTEKAKLLYKEIDRNPLFEGTCSPEDRSHMNVCFVTKDPQMENAFLALAKQKGLVGLKGHRSVGGFRASIYNALPLSSVQVLVDTMQEFENQHD
jgi:phosphoserine aminotransferase